MSNRRIEFDGEWVASTDPTLRALHNCGYSIGAYRDSRTGAYSYALYRDAGTKYVTVLTTHSKDELNNFIKLLLPPEGE